MSFIAIIHQIERLDQLIRFQKTGTPEDLAKTMKISKRTLYRYIDYLKELDCPVYYNENKESYCYKYSGKLNIKYIKKVPDN
jgi:predicted DNA-binding transcriptional regulator YafY